MITDQDSTSTNKEVKPTHLDDLTRRHNDLDPAVWTLSSLEC